MVIDNCVTFTIMQSLISLSDLSLQFNSTEFVLKTQCQIAKDFYSSRVVFPNNFEEIAILKEDILTNISVGLAEVINSNGLTQLFYQIDIPEELYINLLNEPDFIAKMSELILRREAYKIYLRSLF